MFRIAMFAATAAVTLTAAMTAQAQFAGHSFRFGERPFADLPTAGEVNGFRARPILLPYGDSRPAARNDLAGAPDQPTQPSPTANPATGFAARPFDALPTGETGGFGARPFALLPRPALAD